MLEMPTTTSIVNTLAVLKGTTREAAAVIMAVEITAAATRVHRYDAKVPASRPGLLSVSP
jgi:hypothetical protein